MLIAIGVFGLVYYLAFPEIKIAPCQEEIVAVAQSSPPGAMQNWETVIRTSKPEERTVLEVLAAHDGTHLQKLIVSESGLSKLKIH